METENERIERYRQAIQDLLNYMAGGPVLGTSIYDQALFDTQQDRYAVIGVGWDNEKYCCDVVALIEIIDGKVWIQANNTDVAIPRKLWEAGVAKGDMVLGYRPLELGVSWEMATN